MRALGLMSGTSLDGIDAALIETDGERVARFGPVGYRPYTDGGMSSSFWPLIGSCVAPFETNSGKSGNSMRGKCGYSSRRPSRTIGLHLFPETPC